MLVETVVKGDERETPGTELEVEVAYVRGRHDLVGEQLGRTLQEFSGVRRLGVLRRCSPDHRGADAEADDMVVRP